MPKKFDKDLINIIKTGFMRILLLFKNKKHIAVLVIPWCSILHSDRKSFTLDAHLSSETVAKPI